MTLNLTVEANVMLTFSAALVVLAACYAAVHLRRRDSDA